MKVTYKHTGGDTVICDGLGHIGEVGYYTGPLGPTDEVATEWSVEPSRAIRATSSVPIDRGNAEHVYELWVERRFATADEARSFAHGLAGTLPRGGVSLEETDDVAGKLTTYATAVLQRLRCLRNGCSVDVYFYFLTSVPVITTLPS